MKAGLLILIVLSAQEFAGAFSHRLTSFNPNPRECNEGYFTCDDGLCVPNEFLCDGIYDCVGGNDEMNCKVKVSHTRRLNTFNREPRECSDGFFMCDDGLCVPNEFLCDGIYDCVGGSDEMNCKVKVSHTPRLRSFNREPRECSDGFFACDDGLCVPNEFLCDGIYDCVGGSDEMNCKVKVSNKLRPFNPNPRKCNEGYFTCNNGLCVPNEFLCDGIYDCVGGDDEIDCDVKASHSVRLSHDEPRTCNDGYFQCSDGVCVPDAVVCDGIYDCVSGTDEVDCGTTENSLKEN